LKKIHRFHRFLNQFYSFIEILSSKLILKNHLGHKFTLRN